MPSWPTDASFDTSALVSRPDVAITPIVVLSGSEGVGDGEERRALGGARAHAGGILRPATAARCCGSSTAPDALTTASAPTRTVSAPPNVTRALAVPTPPCNPPAAAPVPAPTAPAPEALPWRQRGRAGRSRHPDDWRTRRRGRDRRSPPPARRAPPRGDPARRAPEPATGQHLHHAVGGGQPVGAAAGEADGVDDVDQVPWVEGVGLRVSRARRRARRHPGRHPAGSTPPSCRSTNRVRRAGRARRARPARR